MLLYMALAPEQKLTCAAEANRTPMHWPDAAPPFAQPRTCRFKEGGPAAEARFEAGVAGFEARAFRGCGVFTSGACRALALPRAPGVGPCSLLTVHACMRRALRGQRRCANLRLKLKRSPMRLWSFKAAAAQKST